MEFKWQDQQVTLLSTTDGKMEAVMSSQSHAGYKFYTSFVIFIWVTPVLTLIPISQNYTLLFYL